MSPTGRWADYATRLEGGRGERRVGAPVIRCPCECDEGDGTAGRAGREGSEGDDKSVDAAPVLVLVTVVVVTSSCRG